MAMGEAGVEHIVPVILSSFRGDLEDRVRTLRDQIQSGSMEGAAGAAHALKSSAGTVHALELQRLLEKVEKAAKAGDGAMVQSTFQEVKEEAGRVAAFLALPENSGSGGI